MRCLSHSSMLRSGRLAESIFLQATRVHEDVFDRSIDVQILRLRRKLEQDPSTPQIIQTERGRRIRVCTAGRNGFELAKKLFPFAVRFGSSIPSAVQCLPRSQSELQERKVFVILLGSPALSATTSVALSKFHALEGLHLGQRCCSPASLSYWGDGYSAVDQLANSSEDGPSCICPSSE